MAEITRESKRIVRFIIHDLIEGWTRDTYTPSPRAHKYTHSHCKMISQNVWKKQCRISAPESVRNKKKKNCKVRKLYWLNIKKKGNKKSKSKQAWNDTDFPHTSFCDRRKMMTTVRWRKRELTQTQSQSQSDAGCVSIIYIWVSLYSCSFFHQHDDDEYDEEEEVVRPKNTLHYLF